FANSLEKVSAESVKIDVVEGESSVGGGSFPINPLRTVLVVINLPSGLPERLSVSLRKQDPAILVRVKGNCIYLDLRAVNEHEERVLWESLEEGIGNILGRE
ncbi:MAG: hypothetical protein KAX38_00375, partial [Candidatus Krumholzibacteria bacterium]|nr:hypothetical protein [Candidatus Krumholzibacteria bacterium]